MDNSRKVRHDIFVSYRRDWGNAEKNKDLGCAVARCIVKPLREAGYSVFFDCDEQVDETLPYMRMSKLIVIVLSDVFFDDIVGSNYAKELEEAKALCKPDKSNVLTISINKTFKRETLVGTSYDWLTGVNYQDLRFGKDYRNDIGEVLSKIKEKGLNPGKTKVQRKVQRLFGVICSLAFVLLFVLGYLALILFGDDSLVFVGGGTAKNYLYQEHNINVENYKAFRKGSVYLHMPSENAAVFLPEVFKDSASTLKNVPIVLSAEQFTASMLSEYIDTISFKKRNRIFELKCGETEAQVLLFPKGSFPKDSGTVTTERLLELIADDSTYVVTTNSHSGTYRCFAANCDGLDAFLHYKGRMRGEFSPGTDTNYLTNIMRGNKRVKRIVVLQNECYDIRKVSKGQEEDAKKAKCVTLKRNDGTVCAIPIYIYTVVMEVGKRGNNKNFVFYIDPQSAQGKFIKKLGYESDIEQEVSADSLIVQRSVGGER